MTRSRGPFAQRNPWGFIAYGGVAGLVLASFVIGFVLMPAPGRGALPLWDSICRAIGLQDSVPQPVAGAKAVASNVTWTPAELTRVERGDASRGEFVAASCTACHGAKGRATQAWIPNLAGMDPAAFYKQLADYRSGKRVWPVMNAIARALAEEDLVHAAAYFASLGPAPAGPGPRWASGRGLQSADPIARLVHAGDPGRGIAPCASCHGPNGVKPGAPNLLGQNEGYLVRQLASFAQSLRTNDISAQMRNVARALTPAEQSALAAFYAGAQAQPGNRPAMR